MLQKDGFFRNRRDDSFRQTQPVAPAPMTNAAPAPSMESDKKVDERKESKLVVGPDIKLKGVEISDCDTLVVEGRVDATLDARILEIAENGVFQGTIAVDQAEIRGRFEGEITVRKQLVIQGTGKVSGKVRYARIKVEKVRKCLQRPRRPRQVRHRAQRQHQARRERVRRDFPAFCASSPEGCAGSSPGAVLRARGFYCSIPCFSMNAITSSRPWPVFRLVNTNGRSPRIFFASRSITSSDAPTIGARSILLMTSRSDLRDAGPALARDLVAGGDVDHVERQVGQLGAEGRGEVVAADSIRIRSSVGKAPVQPRRPPRG